MLCPPGRVQHKLVLLRWSDRLRRHDRCAHLIWVACFALLLASSVSEGFQIVIEHEGFSKPLLCCASETAAFDESALSPCCSENLLTAEASCVTGDLIQAAACWDLYSNQLKDSKVRYQQPLKLPGISCSSS